jgi:hypothetical protein
MLLTGYKQMMRKTGSKSTSTLVTFALSALMHIYPLLFLPSTTAGDLVYIGCFFAAQPLLLAAEARLGLSGSAWVGGALAVASPLLLIPMRKLVQ